MRAKVTETLQEWRHLPDFLTLVDIVAKAAEKREIPLLSQWVKLPDYADLYTVVKDLIGNLIDDDNAAKILEAGIDNTNFNGKGKKK